MNTNSGSWTKIVGGLAAVAAAAALFSFLPDLRRYLKIERM